MHKFTTPVSPRCGKVCQANMAVPRELCISHPTLNGMQQTSQI